MHFRQFYVGCLAHASYLVGDGGEAAVVDPSRDVEMYIEEAAAHGLVIRWVLETHLHADFVSGHLELAARTGATIGIGHRAGAAFAHRALREGDRITLGGAAFDVLETPGHTPESLSFVVREHADDREPWGVLTGDTLFVGDVGRVDILSSRLPVEELAGLLYDSLHGKLLKLPDATRVYPAHGAGSLCGRGISQERWSTLGQERRTNAALAVRSREVFVADVTRDVPETPVYFLHSRDLNQAGPAVLAEREMPPALEPRAFAAAAAAAGALVLDTRAAAAFGAGHVPGALNVPLDGQYASWVGTLVGPEQPLLLVCEPDRTEESVMRLARIGYERLAGVLAGGFGCWRAGGGAVATLRSAPIEQAVRDDVRVLDVRRAREWETDHITDAVHVPLSELPQRAAALERDREWVVVCASGYRASIAASVLARAGFDRVCIGGGGMDAWRRAGQPVVAGA